MGGTPRVDCPVALVGPQLPVPLPRVLSLVPLLISWKLDLWAFAANAAHVSSSPHETFLLCCASPFLGANPTTLCTLLPANTPLTGGLSHR